MAAVDVALTVANRLLERMKQDSGAYPQSIAFTLWGTDNIKTYGESLAQVTHTHACPHPHPHTHTTTARETQRHVLCTSCCFRRGGTGGAAVSKTSNTSQQRADPLLFSKPSPHKWRARRNGWWAAASLLQCGNSLRRGNLRRRAGAVRRRRHHPAAVGVGVEVVAGERPLAAVRRGGTGPEKRRCVRSDFTRKTLSS